MKRNQLILLFLGVIAISLAALGANSAKDKSARAKARYYYSAAIREQALGNNAQAYEYFKRSNAADPTYSEASMALGTRRLYVGTDTLQSEEQLLKSLNMIRPFVEEYPDDVYESVNYGYVAGQLGLTEEAVRVLERTYALHPESSEVLLELSDTYARSFDLKNAIDAIDRYERQEGITPQVTTRKIQYLMATDDTVRVMAEVNKLVNSNPNDISFRIIKGNVFDIYEMPDSAFVCYSQAEALDPESGMVKLTLADYYLQKGDSVNYDNKIYEVLLSEDLGLEQKADLVAQYLETQLRNNNDRTRGDYLFSVLKSQYPHEPRVLDLAARYSAAKGDINDAVEQISYALDLDPTNATYWSQLMVYQTSSENPKNALQTFQRAKEHITPDNALKLYYANVAQMVKEYDTAIKAYSDMIHDIDPGLNPDSLMSIDKVRRDISLSELDLLSSLFTSLGDVYNMTGDNTSSYRSYENALVMDPSNSMAKNNYAYFLSINGGDLDKAQKLSSEAITGDDEKNPTYIDTFAWISYLKGDYATAEEYQKKAVELMEETTYRSPEIYEHYGDILVKLNKLSEALEAWRKGAKAHEDNDDTSEPEYAETLKKIKEIEPKVPKVKEENSTPSEKKDE